MKIILRIARVELATLFYSPIAWLLLSIFMLQTSIDFIDKLVSIEAAQSEIGLVLNITKILFSEHGSVLFNVQSKLYLFIPLLTMGLISRETSSGSIKLLLSSPVNSIQIILGKYLTMLILGLLIFGILGIYAISGIVTIQDPDFGVIFSGFLGLYLLFCTYSAIGLFMSSLTTYQVVAAITTFVVFAALSYIGTVWQDFDLVRDFTYYLSFSDRSGEMIRGLVTSRDVIYFISITLFFLMLTYLRLQSTRESVTVRRKLSKYSVMLVALIAILLTTSRQGWILYLDLTKDKVNTLTNTSVEILKRIKEPFQMTNYINLFDPQFEQFKPANRRTDLKRLEPYTRFAPQMKIKYIYYYDSVPGLMFSYPGMNINQVGEKVIYDRNQQPGRFLEPVVFKKVVDIRNPDNWSMRIAQVGNRRAIIQTTFRDIWEHDFETEFTAGIKRALDGPSKIFYITGHNERSIVKSGEAEANSYINVTKNREALINKGFEVDTLNLKYQDIPDDTDGLVLLDPKWNLEKSELEKLQVYIKLGGNLIVAGELRKKEVLRPVLEPLGVGFVDTVLLQRSKDDRPDLIKPVLIRYPADILSSKPDSLRGNLPMAGAAALSFRPIGEFHIKPLMVLDTLNSWLRPGHVDILDSADVKFSPELGDTKKVLPLALGLARKVNNKLQTIVVTGDADLFSNNHGYGGLYLTELALKAFTGNKYPMDFYHMSPSDGHLKLSKKGVFVMKWTYMAVFPGLILVTGSIVLLRRRRK